MSVRQGDVLSARIRAAALPWNRAFGGGPVAVPARGPLRRMMLAGGAAVTVLSPGLQQLRDMQRLWKQELAKAGRSPQSAEMTFERDSELEELSGADVREANAADLDPGNLQRLADAPFREDKSVANGSSIALLIEIGSRSVLVGGDAHASVLENSLRRLLGERGRKRLALDLFIVPHGGSRGSISRELLELVTCNRYMFTSSGEMFQHPDRQTVARIIVYGRSDPTAIPTLIFNYRSEVNRIWANEDLQKLYVYRAVYPDGDRPGMLVHL